MDTIKTTRLWYKDYKLIINDLLETINTIIHARGKKISFVFEYHKNKDLPFTLYGKNYNVLEDKIEDTIYISHVFKTDWELYEYLYWLKQGLAF